MSVCGVRKAAACILTAMVMPKEKRDEIGKRLLRRLGQGIQYAADADQIAEHQKPDQCDAAR